AAALVSRLAAESDPDARALRYRYEYARDNAAGIDSLTRVRLGHGNDADNVPELLAAGRGAFPPLHYTPAGSPFAPPPPPPRAPASTPSTDTDQTLAARSTAHVGRALVMQKRREWDASLAELKLALDERATPEALETLANTLIRLGRTDEAISACEWGVKLDP